MKTKKRKSKDICPVCKGEVRGSFVANKGELYHQDCFANRDKPASTELTYSDELYLESRGER